MHRHRVQTEKRLVGILDEDILALFRAKNHIDNSTDDGPSVVKVECHLGGKVAGLVGKNTEDDVVVVVLGVRAGYETSILLAEAQNKQ